VKRIDHTNQKIALFPVLMGWFLGCYFDLIG